MNSIIIHGRLTSDPELKQTQSGVAVCRFSVAVNRSFQKQGEERTSDFFNCTAWRGLAEMISKYFSKGKEILVSGEMQSQKWKDNNGNDRISWEIQVNNIDFCGNKSDNGSAPTTTAAVPARDFEMLEGTDLQLPF